MSQKYGNGSGRDNYIFRNSGGFQKMAVPGELQYPQNKFMQTLRNKHSSRPDHDLIFTNRSSSPNQYMYRQRHKNIKRNTLCKQVTNRLYESDVQKRNDFYLSNYEQQQPFETFVSINKHKGRERMLNATLNDFKQ